MKMKKQLVVLLSLVVIACVAEAAGGSLTLARMKSVILSEVDFREIRFSDAVEFLKEQSREQDPKKRGINILLKLDPNKNPSITLKLGKSTMYQVLTLITEVAEYQWRYIGSMLVLEPIPEETKR
jgi:hypothetical protein